MNKTWYYADKAKPIGPLSLEELKSILRGVQSWRDILVWREGHDKWQRAASVSDLADIFAAPPPIPESHIGNPATIPREGPKTVPRKTNWKWLISIAVALVTVIVLTLFFHATLGRSSNSTVGFWGMVAFFATLFVTSLEKGARRYVAWLAAIAIAVVALVLAWVWSERYLLGSTPLSPSSVHPETYLRDPAPPALQSGGFDPDAYLRKTSPQAQPLQGITFRSTEFGFRFVYPPNWMQKTPRGPNVRALVDAPDGDSNCNVVVRRVPELGRLSQKEIDAEIFAAPMSEAEWKEQLSNKFPDVKFRERRIIKVDNQPAHFALNEMSYTTVAGSFYFEQMQFVTMTPGLFWNFGCGSGGQNSQTAHLTFQKMRQTFTAILSSFVFER